ncbi:Uncharacterised protein [Mycobacteroides abscessus subsp. abscessus]|nr:Uncharacterised protein [Mycobacteroides abscessus subsp. abscessus]
MQVQPFGAAAQAQRGAGQFGALVGLHLGAAGIGDERPHQDLVVDDTHAVFAQRAEHQLRLVGHPQFAYHRHVQRRTERGRHLVGDRHTAAGHTENHGVGSVEPAHSLDQTPARFPAVKKRHARPPE